MDIKELRKLVFQEKVKIRIDEQGGQVEKTQTDFQRVSTPPATPHAKLGLKGKQNISEPDIPADDDFESFGGPAELQPLEPEDIEATEPAKGLNPQLQALLNNPQFISALKAKLGLK